MFQQTSSKTTGDAVLQAAIQMESTGADFYEAIAVATQNAKVRGLCMKLAAAESRHREVFQQMRSELAGRGETVLLGDQQLAEARKAAKEAILPTPGAVRKMAAGGDIRALLDMAIQVERDSIRFYRSFSSSASDQDSKSLDAIIREEEEHLLLLTAFSSR